MFKLIWMYIKSNFLISDNISASAVSSCKFRVLPWHIDPNMHLTNSRYFYFMDYARFWRLMHMGAFKDIFVKKRWMPMAVSQEITYIRDIAPFEKFEILTQLAGWDEKYVYVVQDFYGKKGLCAKAMVRGLFVCNRVPVPTEEVLKIFGHPPKIEKYQKRIEAWKSVLDFKKQEVKLEADEDSLM